MTSSLVSMIGAGEASGGHEELPWPALAYGVVTFAVFVLLLAVLWSFRNTAAELAKPKHQRRHHSEKQH